MTWKRGQKKLKGEHAEWNIGVIERMKDKPSPAPDTALAKLVKVLSSKGWNTDRTTKLPAVPDLTPLWATTKK